VGGARLVQQVEQRSWWLGLEDFKLFFDNCKRGYALIGSRKQQTVRRLLQEVSDLVGRPGWGGG